MDLPNKKRKLSELETADTGGSDSLTGPKGTNPGGSSSTPTETADGASSSSNAPSGNSYDVFLSFSGRDTRHGFTDHLYHGLVDAGIRTFRDNEDLCRGKKIGPDLFAAIKNSKILIPILSVNYGTSSWCLNELVQIMECKKNNKETIVLPIFYKVEPSDAGHQKGSFGDEFHKREKRLRKRRGFDSTILEKWKEALKEVSSLKGHNATGPEGELVKSVVREVLSELIAKFQLDIPENLIGIESPVEEVMKFLDDNSRATVFVGIHGMGGIGKTTLAKTIYNKLSTQFEYRSFIADIRESCERHGIEYLQSQLISAILKSDYKVSNKDEGITFLSSNFKEMKVLILLDDVDDEDHLTNLARSRDWFSSGSVIIITTRNKSILDNAEGHYNYELEEMDMETSSILFSRHAFRMDDPPSEFRELTDEVVSTTGRLPLSIKVLGSFLRGQPRGVWEDTIKKSRNFPCKKVQETLRISYDALEDEQQQIFLDIACFFNNIDLRIASYMWDACGFYPKEGIAVLRMRSLIKVEEDHALRMHDQLQDLGREIVCQEDKKKPWNRSRLWDSKEVREVLEVLEEEQETTGIEAIYLRKDSSIGFRGTTDQGDNILTGKQFKKLRNLRFLNASGVYFSGDFKNSIKKLKWLQWDNCPSTFEADNFHVEELRVLNLYGSDISDQWRGWSFITMAKKLKYLDLSSCESLEKTSFLSAFENLEVLILSHCWRIEQIDSSIGNMKSLVCLDLSHCMHLEGLPAEVGKLEALEQLNLYFCEGLFSLPDSIGALQNLQVLDICFSGIKRLPDSIGDLQNLEKLDIFNGAIEELPNGIGRLRKLRKLDASACFQLGGETPKSIRNLSSLQRLDLRGCHKLQSVSELPSSLKILGVTCQSRNLSSLSNLTHLKALLLRECEFLECIGEHPSTPLEKSLITPYELEILDIYDCKVLKTVDVSLFTHLRALSAKSCTNLLEIRGLDKLKYLETLYITDCPSIQRLDLPESKGLKNLSARGCENLLGIQGLDRLKSLEEIDISGCASIQRLDLSKSRGLKKLHVRSCEKLFEIQGLDGLESLEEINISGYASIQRLDLSKSKGLKKLQVQSCQNLFEIRGLDGLEFLEEINISGCDSIQRLDLSKCKGLKLLKVESCQNLFEIQGLDELEFLLGYGFERFLRRRQ